VKWSGFAIKWNGTVHLRPCLARRQIERNVTEPCLSQRPRRRSLDCGAKTKCLTRPWPSSESKTISSEGVARPPCPPRPRPFSKLPDFARTSRERASKAAWPPCATHTNVEAARTLPACKVWSSPSTASRPRPSRRALCRPREPTPHSLLLVVSRTYLHRRSVP